MGRAQTEEIVVLVVLVFSIGILGNEGIALPQTIRSGKTPSLLSRVPKVRHIKATRGFCDVEPGLVLVLHLADNLITLSSRRPF